jgi:hypothetical protein
VPLNTNRQLQGKFQLQIIQWLMVCSLWDPLLIEYFEMFDIPLEVGGWSLAGPAPSKQSTLNSHSIVNIQAEHASTFVCPD